MMKQTLTIVTGAAGHLGSTIVGILTQRGEAVRALVLDRDAAPALAGTGAEIVHGDVRRPETLEPLFYNPEGRRLRVIHAAGLVSIASKANPTVYDVNVTGTKNMVALCLKHQVSRLVYVSSVHAIPETPGVIVETGAFSPEAVHGLYAQTKAAATRIVLEGAGRGLNASVVHPSGILGPGDFGRAHLTQLVVDYLNGRLTACVQGAYDFVDVRDVAQGVLACLDRGEPGECYILSGHHASIQALLDILSRVGGRKKVSLVLPMWLARLTAPLAEGYYKILRQPPLYTAYSLYTVGTNGNFSHQKATQALEYHPRPLETTLADTCQWLREAGRVRPGPTP